MKRTIGLRSLEKPWRLLLQVLAFVLNLILSSISEERCRLCQGMLGIAHHLFKLTAQERFKRGQAWLFREKGQKWFCERSTALCHGCYTSLVQKARPRFDYPDFKAAGAVKVVSGGEYDDALRTLIHRFKFADDRALLPDLASIILRTDLANLTVLRTLDNSWIVVAVPLHWRRKMSRGFNQAELLGKSVARRIHLKYCGDALRRVRSTRPQMTLGHDERESNLKEAFVARRAVVKGKRIILVDDICTSGSTLAACYQALMAADALEVVTTTIARASMKSMVAPPGVQ